MNLDFLEQFSENRGREISRILLEKYGPSDFEINTLEIEQEIYEIAVSYSRILFFEARKLLHEDVRVQVRSYISSRFEVRKIEKLTDIDLIAHWIKSEVINKLRELECII